MAENNVPRMQKQYFEEVLPALAKYCKRDNVLSLPRLQKIVINMGVGTGVTEKKHVEESSQALAQIAGQKALITRCLLYTSPSPRDRTRSRMPSSA